jgi:hypothetical protein
MPRPRKPGSGGAREGTPGKSYQNRSDLTAHQPVRTVPNQPYGVAGAQQAAQQQIPLPQGPTLPPPIPLGAPTTRPNEPVTSGIASGPGPGPEALGPGTGPTPLDELKAMYRIAPFEELRKLIQYAEQTP